jgi:hypothetical protein
MPTLSAPALRESDGLGSAATTATPFYRGGVYDDIEALAALREYLSAHDA